MYQQQPSMYPPPPTYQPPQKPPHSRKRLWIIICIVAAGLLLGGFIVGGIAGTLGKTTTTPPAQPTQQATTQPVPTLAPTEVPQPTPTVVPQPTQSSAQLEKPYKSSTQATTVTTLDKQGNAWKGKDVHFTSTISDFVKDSDGNTAYSNVDDPNSSGVILIVFPSGTDFEKLNAGDTLEVWGFDTGTVSGTNGFGATIQEVAVDVMYMTDQTTGYATH
jgi:hypothetical protein